MVSSELLAELHKLGRAEKFQVVQLLIGELAVEENSRITSAETSPLFSRLGDEATAQALLQALHDAEVADQNATQRG